MKGISSVGAGTNGLASVLQAGGRTAASAGGGGGASGSAATTTTTTNPDGSITTTVTGPNGAVLSTSKTGGSSREGEKGPGNAGSAGLLDVSA